MDRRLAKAMMIMSIAGLLWSGNLLAGAPDVLWTRIYGTGLMGECRSVCETTADHGYVVIGVIIPLIFDAPYGSHIIKTDERGDTVWVNTLDHLYSITVRHVEETSEGEYLITGGVLLMKLGADGTTLWTRYFGNGSAEGRSVRETFPDKGYVVVGAMGSSPTDDPDIYLVKTDSSGNTLWTRTYGDTAREMGYSVEQTSDGGYIITGSSYSPGGGNDIILVKTDPNGNATWIRTYSGPVNQRGYSVLQASDGGYLVLGSTWSWSGQEGDVYLIKTDPCGDVLWTRTYGGPGYDAGYEAQKTSDGGYVIVGETKSFGSGSSDIYVLKTDAEGDTLWTETYGGEASDRGCSIHQTYDGGYIIAGTTSSFGHFPGNPYYYLIRTEGRCWRLRESQFGDPEIHNVQVPQAGTGMLGNCVPSGGYAVCFTCEEYTPVRLTVFDIQGRIIDEVPECVKPAGNNVVVWDGRDRNSNHVAPGIYFLRVLAGSQETVSKVAVVR